jgi:metal-responsive CopG/Arc/MetJ family transcriptional regulator
MSMARRFKGQPIMRLIVSVPDDVVQAVDTLLKSKPRHPARGNRAEFVRLAIAEKLSRDKAI